MNKNELAVINTQTGEVVTDVVILTKEEVDKLEALREKRKEYFDKKQHKQLSRAAKDETFIWLIKSEDGFMDIAPHTLARLVYLATHLGYKKSLNKLKKRADVERIMNLGKNIFNTFYNEIVQKGYLIKTDDGIEVNPKYFRRGQLRYINNDTKVVRVYIRAYRQLYQSLSHRDHKYLGYLIRGIGNLNTQWNVICENPWEEDEGSIKPTSLAKLCRIIKYDTKQTSRLKNGFNRLKFNWNAKEQQLVAFTSDNGYKKIVVNPNVFYAGDNYDKIKMLGIFFKGTDRKDG